MSRKSVSSDSFNAKPSRNDRFAQMSRQEQVIEQKKREIQARLQQQQQEQQQQQKEKPTTPIKSGSSSQINSGKKNMKPLWKGNLGTKPNQNANNKLNSQFNIFSNDGSFLDQFKQINDTTNCKKSFGDQKITISSIKNEKVRDNQERDERNKPSRWSKSTSQPIGIYPSGLTDELLPVKKASRFSDPSPERELERQPLTSFAPTFNNAGDIFTNNFGIQPPNQFPVVVTSGAPQHLVPPPTLTIPIIPPPQILSTTVSNNVNCGALIAPPPPHTSITNHQSMTGGGGGGSGISVPPPVITLSVVPPPGMELISIPAPNPIPLHSIPQPEPINTLTIPPPAPLQLQNIPSPSPIRLTEIPKPKPIDVVNIPAPSDETKLNKTMTDPDFIKNVPPPNKSVPPPNLGQVTVTEFPNVAVPPPISNPSSLPLPILTPHQQLINTVTNTVIPSLMAQPVLPPPGMVHTGPPPSTAVNVSQVMINILPPVSIVSTTALPGPPPVLNQPPPLAQTSHIPPMNFPPPLGPPPAQNTAPIIDMNSVCPPGSASHDAMVSLGRMVAQCGSGIEDIVQQRSAQDPSLWFLFHKQSTAYQQYRQLVEQFRTELGTNQHMNQTKKQYDLKSEYQPEDIYEPENVTDDEHPQNVKLEDNDNERIRKRKRKSRWGEKVDGTILIQQQSSSKPSTSSPMLTKVTRNDPGLVQYAINTFGSSNLSEEEWNKAEDHYKINLLYQEMVRKRQEIERLKRQGRNKYEYDSDEETDGGTWEHKLRVQEMEATQLWANELTRQAEGKHHIGDFLPPDELKKFMEKYSAAKEGRQPNLSDYKEFKLKEDNIGFKMLQKLGWQEGQGLGSDGTGIVEPVNKASLRDQNQGLGLQQLDGIGNADDEYDAYRKRMMLAYRFRPNPLNNPRRPYY